MTRTKLEDHEHRIIRIEAVLGEMGQAFKLFEGDRAWEEREEKRREHEPQKTEPRGAHSKGQ